MPHLGRDVREEVSAICARFPSARLEILPGKSVVEVKQPPFNKGTAVRDLMQHAPFKGRRPIFIGDDVTDEAAFEVMPEFDGIGFSVGREVQGIAGMFEAPRDVRRWIAEMVRAGRRAMNVQPNVDIAAAQQNLDLAVVGNGRTLALVNPLARIVWWCFPRFDSDPVFCRLLAGDEEKGFTDVLLDGFVSAHSEYVRNTAIVTTVLTDRQGASVRITDFAPRFEQFGRIFRPPQLMRIIEPVAGLPRITIRFRPTSGHGQANMQRAFGCNHIRYTGGETIRLTTDAPLSYIDRESPFVLTRPVAAIHPCRIFFFFTCMPWLSILLSSTAIRPHSTSASPHTVARSRRPNSATRVILTRPQTPSQGHLLNPLADEPRHYGRRRVGTTQIWKRRRMRVVHWISSTTDRVRRRKPEQSATAQRASASRRARADQLLSRRHRPLLRLGAAAAGRTVQEADDSVVRQNQRAAAARREASQRHLARWASLEASRSIMPPTATPSRARYAPQPDSRARRSPARLPGSAVASPASMPRVPLFGRSSRARAGAGASSSGRLRGSRSRSSLDHLECAGRRVNILDRVFSRFCIESQSADRL